jgi:hypothetical protein
MPPDDDDEVVIRGLFENAISEELDQTARSARGAARALTETGAGGEVAGAGMDRASISAARLKGELNGVERAAEQQRLAQLRLMSAEAEASKIRQKGVLTAQDTARVETMLSAARAQARRATEDLTVAHRELDRATDNLATRFLRTAGSVSVLEKAYTGLRFVATTTVVTALAGGVASLGAAGVAAVAGLAPLMGLAGGIPALALAAGSAGIAVHFLAGGVTAAVKAMESSGPGSAAANNAMRTFGPNTRAAAYEVYDFTYSLRGMREEAMSQALPFLHGSLENIERLLPTLRTGLNGVVTAVGDVAEQGTARIAGWSGDLDTIFASNASLIHTLGESGIDALDIVRHLMVGAIPMVSDLSTRFEGEMQRVDDALARNPQAVEDFFNRVERRTLSTLHVLSDFGHGILVIFREASPLTDHMGDGLLRDADRFRAWTDSARGRNEIRQFFVDAIPVVDATGHLIGEILKAFGTLGRDSNAAAMLNDLAELVPVATKLLTIIEQIANTVPGGNSVLGLMFVGSRLGLSPGLLARGTFGGIRGGVRFARGARGVEGALESPAGRTGARIAGLFGRGASVAAVGEEGAAAAGGAAGIAEGGAGLLPLVANPVGAAVVGAAALAVGGYELYQHWKPFHDLVDSIGRGLKEGFGWVEHHLPQIGRYALMVFAPITIPVKFVYDHFKDLEHLVENIAGKISHLPGVGLAKDFAGWISGLYTGGPVEADRTYLTGELGTELFVGASGRMRVLGGDGAELLRSAEPGFVLPHEALRAITDVGVRNQAARAFAVAPVSGGSTTEDGGGSYRPNFGDWPPGFPPDWPPVTIGPNYFYDEMDVERAVVAGIQRAERERKDRR